LKKEHEKEFLNIFQQLCYGRNTWQVWEDVITMIATSIANATEYNEQNRKEREQKYCDCVKRINKNGDIQLVVKLMSIIVMALEENPEQDFLGAIYMKLELFNHWKGQFFTPYHICKVMVDINTGNIQKELEEKDFLSICDPTCGAGALLIAYANAVRNKEINYQQKILFVGQDIDVIVVMMCYIQLSLLGCAGYIVIADTLTNPICGDVLNPIEKEGQQFWYMPMFQTGQWYIKRLLHNICYAETKKEETEQKVTEQKPTELVEQKIKFDLENKKQNNKNSVMTGQLDLFSMLK